MRPARSREELDPASEGDAAYSLDTKGVPATRRERIEAAVEAGGKHLAAPPRSLDRN